MGYKIHEGIGTSMLIMAFISASSALGHAMTGNLPLEAAVYSALDTVLGGKIAARYTNKVKEAILNKIVGIVLVY